MKVIKEVATRRGYAIAITERTARNGGTYYAIDRVSPDVKHFTLHRTADLQEARKLANREWLADRG